MEQIKILRPEDSESILKWEMERLVDTIADPIEREFSSWKSNWRRESLDHYLPQGWSFAAWSEDKKLRGYFIAQPILFFEGLTQVLWVEWMSWADTSAAEKLVDTAVRWGRDKHLQRVLFSQGAEIKKFLGEHASRGTISPRNFLDIQTTKIQQ